MTVRNWGQLMFCTKCGAENADTGKFCRKCGTPLRQRTTSNASDNAEAETKPESQHDPAAKLASETSPALQVPAPQEAPRVITEPPPQKQTDSALPQAPPSGGITFQLKPNIAAAACYLLGWVTGIIFILLTKEQKVIRFHAWQSVITFEILTVSIQLLLWPSLLLRGLNIGLVILYYLLIIFSFVLWILLMYKAYKGEIFKLPFAGSLAQKLA